MGADEPLHDDPVLRRVAAARPPIPEDDLSPDGWRAHAIRDRVRTGAPSASRAPRGHRSRNRPWFGPLRTGLGVAAIIAPVVLVIVIVVIAAASHGHDHVGDPATRHPLLPTAPPTPRSLLPAHGGMRGLLSTPQLVGDGSDLTAIFGQCPNCRTRLHGNGTTWQSRSVDEGRAWRTGRVSAPRAASLGMAAQAGDAVWTNGSLGESTSAIFVSHAGGRYRTAATAATPAADSPLTISDGAVWAIGNRCAGSHCRAVVMSGPAGGDRLAATRSQPDLRPHHDGVQAVIGAHGSTVVVNGGFATADLQTFVSHDAGRSWAQVTYPCRRPVEGDVYPTSAESLWAVCLATSTPAETAHHGTYTPVAGSPRDIIRRSSDGGRHWTTTATLTLEQPTLSASSDQVAWITGENGTVARTTDGGLRWETVLRTQAGAELAVQDARNASIVVAASREGRGDHDRRTDLVSYRTTDGGARWTPTLIRLPTG